VAYDYAAKQSVAVPDAIRARISELEGVPL
jgi:hypothetical protein